MRCYEDEKVQAACTHAFTSGGRVSSVVAKRKTRLRKADHGSREEITVQIWPESFHHPMACHSRGFAGRKPPRTLVAGRKAPHSMISRSGNLRGALPMARRDPPAPRRCDVPLPLGCFGHHVPRPMDCNSVLPSGYGPLGKTSLQSIVTRRSRTSRWESQNAVGESRNAVGERITFR